LTQTHDATSAGAIATLDNRISHRAKEVMDEISVSTDGQRSKQLTPELIKVADKVVLFPTDFMPEYALNDSKAEFWDVIDPHYHKEDGMPLVREVRDDILNRVKHLINTHD
jgi:protein-tyrosine-phosphatase